MSKTIKIPGRLQDAICIRRNRKDHILFVQDLYGTVRRSNKALYIANYSNFGEEKPQMLKIFSNSVGVKITYAKGYLYVAEYNMVNKLTRYSIMQDKDTFFLHEEENIKFLDNESMRIQSIASSKSGKVAVFDMSNGNIYEVSKNKKRLVRCTGNGFGILHQNICYVGDKLVSSFDLKICDKSKELLEKCSFAIEKIGPLVDTHLHFVDKTGEMAFGMQNVILFEKDNNFNGLIYLENKKVISVTSNLRGGIIIASNDYYKDIGYITILNSKDIIVEKAIVFAKINYVREEIKEIMQSIVTCSDGEYDIFIEFANEFKFRKYNMYEDMKYLIKKGVVGKEALKMYNSIKKN